MKHLNKNTAFALILGLILSFGTAQVFAGHLSSDNYDPTQDLMGVEQIDMNVQVCSTDPSNISASGFDPTVQVIPGGGNELCAVDFDIISNDSYDATKLG